MNEFLSQSAFFGTFLSLLFFEVGTLLKKRFRSVLVNPLLIGSALTVSFLLIFDIDYPTYKKSAQLLSTLLTPATVCLAIPLYEQFELLRKNRRAVLCGIVAGSFASMLIILVFCLLCGLSHAEYVTLLPKSVTSAIGMGISGKMGGYPALTTAMIILSGITGNIIAEPLCRFAHITEPVAKGVGIGTASHAIGTAKAMEMGEIEGAMSGLAICVAGLVTVVGAMVFERLY